MLATIIMSVLLAVTFPVASRPAETQVHHEYCVVSQIEYVDEITDLVIVRTVDGEESDFYADACTFTAPQCVEVTFSACGEIIDAVPAW